MKCWGNMQRTAEDETSALAGSFADDPVPLSSEKLEEMANTWMFIEDDPVMVNSMIDDTCGLDGEGTGTGSGEGAE